MKSYKNIKNKKYFEAIFDIIEKAGSRNNLCEILDITKQAISNWLNLYTHHKPSYENAVKIEAIFGVDKKIFRGK